MDPPHTAVEHPLRTSGINPHLHSLGPRHHSLPTRHGTLESRHWSPYPWYWQASHKDRCGAGHLRSHGLPDVSPHRGGVTPYHDTSLNLLGTVCQAGTNPCPHLTGRQLGQSANSGLDSSALVAGRAKVGVRLGVQPLAEEGRFTADPQDQYSICSCGMAAGIVAHSMAMLEPMGCVHNAGPVFPPVFPGCLGQAASGTAGTGVRTRH